MSGEERSWYPLPKTEDHKKNISSTKNQVKIICRASVKVFKPRVFVTFLFILLEYRLISCSTKTFTRS